MAKSLSKINQDQDMKKLKVNAQVTAVTTLLEFVGNCVTVVLWALVTKMSGYETLIQRIVLNFVILPYTFLMNTEHNKNRVVEDGWRNVLKNMFQICKSDLPLSDNEVENVRQRNVQPTSSSAKDSSRPTVVKENNKQGKPMHNGRNSNDNDLKIFTIFRNPSIIESPINLPTLNVPIYEEPCSSKHGVKSSDTNLSIDSDELPVARCPMNLRLEMISNMLSNITDEKLYINCFKRFISFEETLKTGNDISNFLSNTHLQTLSCDNFNPKFRLKGRNGKRAQHTVKENVSSDEAKFSTELTYGLEEDESMAKLEFFGDFENRIDIRKKMLNRLLTHFENDEEMYNDSVEMFINVEEDLLVERSL